MLTKSWRNVQVRFPSAGIVSLPKLYGNGFFISAVYGTEAWVISKKTFESQPMRLIGEVPQDMCKGMINYNERQYKRFLAKQQRLMSHLSENHCQFQL